MKMMTAQQYRNQNELEDRPTMHDLCTALGKEILSDNGLSYNIPKKIRNHQKKMDIDIHNIRHVLFDFFDVVERDPKLREWSLKWINKKSQREP